MVKKILALLGIALSLMGLLACQKESAAKVQKTPDIFTTEQADQILPVKEAAKWLKKSDFLDRVVVIDTREEADYEEGHLPNAISCPQAQLRVNLDRLRDLGREILVYGSTEKDGKKAASLLQKEGFNKVRAIGPISNDAKELVTYTSLLPDQFLQGIKAGKVTLVDGRSQKLFEKGRIEGAIHGEVKRMDQLISKLPKDKEIGIYVYATRGRQAARLAQGLDKAGYPHVYQAILGTQEYEYYPVKP